MHRLPAVANIIMTPEYLHFTQQIMTSHDRAIKQAEMDVSPPMGDMLTEMQGCLKQLCGNSAVGNPEAVAQFIAEKMAAMNISPSQNSCDDLLALPAPKQVTATEAQAAVPSDALDFTSGLIVWHQHCMIPVAVSAPSLLHGQNGTMDPPPLQRGSRKSKLWY